MKKHPHLREQIRLHNRANPWILIGAVLIAAATGLLLEHSYLTTVQMGDASMAPQIVEGEKLLFCQHPHCIKALKHGDPLLIDTPEREKVRQLAAMWGDTVQLQRHNVFPLTPPEEPSQLVIPQSGMASDPVSWSPLAFDALFPALLAELDSNRRSALQIRMRWNSGKELLEERTTSAHSWLNYSEMNRHAALLRSHRPGSAVRWERLLLYGDKPIREHIWKKDHLLLEPTSPGWSWWVLPLDSLSGKRIFSSLPLSKKRWLAIFGSSDAG